MLNCVSKKWSVGAAAVSVVQSLKSMSQQQQQHLGGGGGGGGGGEGEIK